MPYQATNPYPHNQAVIAGDGEVYEFNFKIDDYDTIDKFEIKIYDVYDNNKLLYTIERYYENSGGNKKQKIKIFDETGVSTEYEYKVLDELNKELETLPAKGSNIHDNFKMFLIKEFCDFDKEVAAAGSLPPEGKNRIILYNNAILNPRANNKIKFISKNQNYSDTVKTIIEVTDAPPYTKKVDFSNTGMPTFSDINDLKNNYSSFYYYPIILNPNRKYTWTLRLYSSKYDVWITENQTFETSSNLPKVYVPNNDRMEVDQEIILKGTDDYLIEKINTYSNEGKIYYRQSKGSSSTNLTFYTALNGYFTIDSPESGKGITEVTGTIDSDMEKGVTIGSTFTFSYGTSTTGITGTIIEKTSDNKYKLKLNSSFEKTIDNNEALLTLDGFRITEGVVSTDFINLLHVKDTTTTPPTTGSLFKLGNTIQEVTEINKTENLIKFQPASGSEYYLSEEEGDHTVSINLLKSNNVLPSDLNENEIVIIGRYNTPTDNLLTDLEASSDTGNPDTTDLHITLNYINRYDVSKVELFSTVKTTYQLEDGTALYKITTTENCSPTDFQVSEPSLQKAYTLERESSILTLKNKTSGVPSGTISPSTAFAINSNNILSSPYYFTTIGNEEVNFYKEDGGKITGEFITITSSLATFTATYSEDIAYWSWSLERYSTDTGIGVYDEVYSSSENFNNDISMTYDFYENISKDGSDVNNYYVLTLKIVLNGNYTKIATLKIRVIYNTDYNPFQVKAYADCEKEAIKVDFSGLQEIKGKIYEGDEYIGDNQDAAAREDFNIESLYEGFRLDSLKHCKATFSTDSTESGKHYLTIEGEGTYTPEELDKDLQYVKTRIQLGKEIDTKYNGKVYVQGNYFTYTDDEGEVTKFAILEVTEVYSNDSHLTQLKYGINVLYEREFPDVEDDVINSLYFMPLNILDLKNTSQKPKKFQIPESEEVAYGLYYYPDQGSSFTKLQRIIFSPGQNRYLLFSGDGSIGAIFLSFNSNYSNSEVIMEFHTDEIFSYATIFPEDAVDAQDLVDFNYIYMETYKKALALGLEEGTGFQSNCEFTGYYGPPYNKVFLKWNNFTPSSKSLKLASDNIIALCFNFSDNYTEGEPIISFDDTKIYREKNISDDNYSLKINNTLITNDLLGSKKELKELQLTEYSTSNYIAGIMKAYEDKEKTIILNKFILSSSFDPTGFTKGSDIYFKKGEVYVKDTIKEIGSTSTGGFYMVVTTNAYKYDINMTDNENLTSFRQTCSNFSLGEYDEENIYYFDFENTTTNKYFFTESSYFYSKHEGFNRRWFTIVLYNNYIYLYKDGIFKTSCSYTNEEKKSLITLNQNINYNYFKVSLSQSLSNTNSNSNAPVEVIDFLSDPLSWNKKTYMLANFDNINLKDGNYNIDATQEAKGLYSNILDKYSIFRIEYKYNIFSNNYEKIKGKIIKIAEVDSSIDSENKRIIYDYSIKKGARYSYIVIPYFLNNDSYVAGTLASSEDNGLAYINYDHYSIYATKQKQYNNLQLINSNKFELDNNYKIWNFKYNLNENNVTINTDKTVYDGLYKYARVNRGPKNYRTGNISGILGELENTTKNIEEKTGEIGMFNNSLSDSLDIWSDKFFSQQTVEINGTRVIPFIFEYSDDSYSAKNSGSFFTAILRNGEPDPDYFNLPVLKKEIDYLDGVPYIIIYVEYKRNSQKSYSIETISGTWLLFKNYKVVYTYYDEREVKINTSTIELADEWQAFCDTDNVKVIRDPMGNIIPVDITPKSFTFRQEYIPNFIEVDFEWTQVADHENTILYSIEE